MGIFPQILSKLFYLPPNLPHEDFQRLQLDASSHGSSWSTPGQAAQPKLGRRRFRLDLIRTPAQIIVFSWEVRVAEPWCGSYTTLGLREKFPLRRSGARPCLRSVKMDIAQSVASKGAQDPALVLLEENILLRYGVDLLAVGHDHVYQRSEKMGFGLPNPLGYVQVLVGTGGQSIRIFDDNGPQIWSASEFVGVGYCKYFVSPGKIRGEYYGAPPLDMSDEGRQYTTGEFALRDSFEIDARSQLACEMCVLPARGPDILLADFEAISRHTRERNHRILSHHC